MQGALTRIALTAALLLGLAGVAGSRSSSTAENNRMILQNFKTRGTDEAGGNAWELLGARAVIEGELAQLEEVTVNFFVNKGETVVVTSPRCTFNRVTKIGSSDAAIHVWHRQATIDGKGYDIITDEHRLHIRNEVKMIIKQDENSPDLMNLLAPAGPQADNHGSVPEPPQAPPSDRDSTNPNP